MSGIVNNLTAMNTNRQLNIVTKAQNRQMEQLASGYKINRSADDAAGLTMSEKMRWQIHGLNRASQNIQDGVSLLQIADGALAETHSVLQRMRELAVQAGNDTNTIEDRSAMQKEISALSEEIDRIATQTTFNEEIYPLRKTTGYEWRIPSELVGSKQSAYAEAGAVVDKTKIEKAGQVTLGTVNYSGKGIPAGASYVAISKQGIEIVNGNSSPTKTIAKDAQWSSLSYSDLQITAQGYIFFKSQDGGNKYIQLATEQKDFALVSSVNDSCLRANHFWLGSGVQDGRAWIQTGALSQQGMYLHMVDATAYGIGIQNVSVSTYQDASAAITTIDGAIDKVNEYRSQFGAIQNRLEYSMQIDDNIAENTQAAESKIRDTDMSTALVNYSKNNILAQAGQAILAQANQNTGILELLR